jgi:flagellar hook-associated protein 2
MISAPGIGSGLDVGGIVDQLMAVERRPLNQLEAGKQDLKTQLSTLGQLKSSLATFQSALSDLKNLDAFEVYQAESSDETAFTATANSDAAIGFSDIEVIRLAEAHKMGSQAIADTDTTTLGRGGDGMTLTVDGNAFTVNAGGMTLSEIRDAINDAPDNTGVSASIISENSGSHHLVLSAIEPGNDNAVALSVTGRLNRDLGLSDINDPTQLDSELLVDGLYTITRSSNTIDDAITGLTLNLLGETTGAAQLTVSRDIDSVKQSAQTFVDAFNELRTTMKNMSGDDSALDSTLRSIESRMRGVFNTSPSGLNGSFNYLTEVGVSFQRDGSLSLDSADLEAAIAGDFADVAELFAHDDQGYLFRLDSVIEGFIEFNGQLDNREDSLNNRINAVDDRIFEMEFRLGLREKTLLDQFNALDTLMGTLQGTSDFLTQQLAALPTIQASSQ